MVNFGSNEVRKNYLWNSFDIIDLNSTCNTQQHENLEINERIIEIAKEYQINPSITAFQQLHSTLYQDKVFYTSIPIFPPPILLSLLDIIADQILSIQTKHQASELNATKTSVIKDEQQLWEVFLTLCTMVQIGYPSYAVGKVLEGLVATMSNIAINGDCSNEKVILAKLQLLSLLELVKKDARIQKFVKEMSCIKDFYRAITILLNSTEDTELLILVMASLAQLVLRETIGTKFFSSTNVEKVFELVFSFLLTSVTINYNIQTAQATQVNQRLLISFVGVDLIKLLGSRSDILLQLEEYPGVGTLIQCCLNEYGPSVQSTQIQFAVHFLTTIIGLSPKFRTTVLQQLAMQNSDTSLDKILECIHSPTSEIASATVDLILGILKENHQNVNELVDSYTEAFCSVITGALASIDQLASDIKTTTNISTIIRTNFYEFVANLCDLLSQLCRFLPLKTFCAQKIRLNQCATIIQVESAHIYSTEAAHLIKYTPHVSMNLLILFSSIVTCESLSSNSPRKLKQFLESSEVSLVYATALILSQQKQKRHIIPQTVLLYHQLVSDYSDDHNRRAQLIERFSHGIFSVSQKLLDELESLDTRIISLEGHCQANSKLAQDAQRETHDALNSQDELKNKFENEVQRMKSTVVEQLRLKEEQHTKTREQYESTIRTISTQYEQKIQLLTNKIEEFEQNNHQSNSTLQNQEQLIKDYAKKLKRKEEQCLEWKHNAERLETRLEEVAHAHAILMEKNKHGDKELDNLRNELTILSGEYTTVQDNLQLTREAFKRLELDMEEKDRASEKTYRELVYAAKAAKAITNEKVHLTKEVNILRERLLSMETKTELLEKQLQESRHTNQGMEQKIMRMRDIATSTEKMAEDERKLRRSTCQELENIREMQRHAESEVSISELRLKELQMLLQSKDETIQNQEDEIKRLTAKMGKNAKLQALIHQLSSGRDVQASSNLFNDD